MVSTRVENLLLDVAEFFFFWQHVNFYVFNQMFTALTNCAPLISPKITTIEIWFLYSYSAIYYFFSKQYWSKQRCSLKKITK